MVFKDKLNEIFGIGAPTVVIPQEKPRDVIELTPIEDFRNNVRARLNGIKSNAVMGVVNGGQPSNQVPSSEPCCADGMLVERENEIGVDTLKGSVRNLGTPKISELVAKLSVEKNEVDKKTGIATSKFEKFINGLKQEAIEVLMGSEVTPTDSATPATPAPEGGATPEVPITPEEKSAQSVVKDL